jgi:TonB family protein
MGTLITPDHETQPSTNPEQENREHETRPGAFKHNGRMGLETSGFRAGQPRVAEPQATMANDLLTQPETGSRFADDGHEFDGFLGKAFEEKPIWTALYESIRDVFFPQKLPPLVLTSTPIPVPDRMAVKPNPWAIGIAAFVNLSILAAVLYFGARAIIKQIDDLKLNNNVVDVGEFKFKAPAGEKAGGGGGGGDHDLVQAIKGKLPPKMKDPVTPPQVQTVDKPLLPMQAAIDVQKDLVLPDNPNLPNLGVTKSANVTLASNGTGGGTGIGSGYGGGIGSGTGNGYGPGYGGNAGGGVERIGGEVSQPTLIFGPDPDFSDEARRAKYQGVVTISLIVDAQGNPQNVRVTRALGMGLDEKAVEAVQHYKFKPALKHGKAVAVYMSVEVNFRLY